jgi:acetyltransferase-like isoleucine patch superfamily enzyme
MTMIRWFHLSLRAIVKEFICRILDWPFFFQTPFTEFKPRALNRLFGAQLAPDCILSHGVRAVNWRNVTIESGSYVGPRVDLRSHGPITIGRWSMIGPEAMLLSGSHRKSDLAAITAPIVIGQGVFVGARVLILHGVTVGDHAMIGAGAVVSRDIPPLAIAVGSPARIVGYRDMPGRIWSMPGMVDLETGALVETS